MKINPKNIQIPVAIFLIVMVLTMGMGFLVKENSFMRNTIALYKQDIKELKEKVKGLKYDLLDDKRLTEQESKLMFNSDLYKFRETPWQILSCVHFEEQTRKFENCPSSKDEDGNVIAAGCMQFITPTWNSYCEGMTRGYIHDDIACADRYIQANFKKSGFYHVALWQYNHDMNYVNRVLNCASDYGFTFNK